MTHAKLNLDAIALVRALVAAFPEVGTDEPINGGDAVDIIAGLCTEAQSLIGKIDECNKEQKGLKRYIDAAHAGYYDDIDFDDAAFTVVSPGADPGAYVSCWIWVGNQDVREWAKYQRGKKKERMKQP